MEIGCNFNYAIFNLPKLYRIMTTITGYSETPFPPVKYLAGMAVLIFCLYMTGNTKTKAADLPPGQWKFECQRSEIAPQYRVDENLLYGNQPTLLLGGGGKYYANGHWYKTVEVTPGEFRDFRAHFQYSGVEEPGRCILSRIIWLDKNDKQVGEAEYPKWQKDKTENGWDLFEQVYKIPEKAMNARLELHYRWDADGTVHYAGISFDKSGPIEPRLVRLGTVFLKPYKSSGPEENREKFGKLVAEAAAKKADIVCLPEALTLPGTGLNYVSASEPVPGPSTEFFGELARKYHMYIVAGILERSGPDVFNTAVLIDREGRLAGKYHKLCLPREEIEGGITPGDSVPVFDTDFGRIGLMICWDESFPEVARALAMKGADVILMPIAGGNITLTKARAIENQVYLVSSTYDMISAVFDQEGNILSQASDKDRVVVSEVDLNKQLLWPWIGDLKNRIIHEMPAQKAMGSR